MKSVTFLPPGRPFPTAGKSRHDPSHAGEREVERHQVHAAPRPPSPKVAASGPRQPRASNRTRFPSGAPPDAEGGRRRRRVSAAVPRRIRSGWRGVPGCGRGRETPARPARSRSLFDGLHLQPDGLQAPPRGIPHIGLDGLGSRSRETSARPVIQNSHSASTGHAAHCGTKDAPRVYHSADMVGVSVERSLCRYPRAGRPPFRAAPGSHRRSLRDSPAPVSTSTTWRPVSISRQVRGQDGLRGQVVVFERAPEFFRVRVRKEPRRRVGEVAIAQHCAADGPDRKAVGARGHIFGLPDPV